MLSYGNDFVLKSTVSFIRHLLFFLLKIKCSTACGRLCTALHRLLNNPHRLYPHIIDETITNKISIVICAKKFAGSNSSRQSFQWKPFTCCIIEMKYTAVHVQIAVTSTSLPDHEYIMQLIIVAKCNLDFCTETLCKCWFHCVADIAVVYGAFLCQWIY